MDIIATRRRGARFRRKDFTPDDKLNGVVVYLYDKGITQAEEAHKVIQEYGKHINHETSSQGNTIKIAVKIQENFPAFVEWFRTR